LSEQNNQRLLLVSSIIVGLTIGFLIGGTYVYHLDNEAEIKQYQAVVFNTIGKTATVIDNIQLKTLTNIEINIEEGQYGAHFNENKNKLYLIHDGESELFTLNPQSLEIESRVRVGPNLQHAGIFDETGEIFFLISRDSNSLIMINTTTDRIISRIEVQEQPHHIALLNDGVAVTNTKSLSISIVDIIKMEVKDNIKIDAEPLMIVSNKNDKMFVGAINPSKIFFIDNNEVKNSINLESDPHGIALTLNGDNLLVTIPEDDKILIINMKGEIVKELMTGSFPHNIDIDPDGRYGYISNSNDASVSIIDLTNFEIVATLETGNGSHNVQFYNILNSNTQLNKIKDNNKIISANFNCGG
jgi:DNA-binding beta-propeller fold protein YncE